MAMREMVRSATDLCALISGAGSGSQARCALGAALVGSRVTFSCAEGALVCAGGRLGAAGLGVSSPTNALQEQKSTYKGNPCPYNM